MAVLPGETIMNRNSKCAGIAVAAIIGFVGTALASDILMTHKPGTYKMSKFAKSGENIPLNGPVIHVFSKSKKKYDTIANDNGNLKHASVVGGICGRRSHDFGSASVKVGGTSHSVSGTGDHVLKNHTESFQFPFTLPNISRKPAAACNFELDKRVAQGNKSREYWMNRGFVVRYENAYEATFTASCSGGVARGDFGAKKIKTPVWITCAPTKTASQSKPDKPKRAPKSRARPMPLKVKATLEANQKGVIYAQKCPVAVRYTGSIWVSKPKTTISYQIVGSGWTSPERKITFQKMGKQQITGWTQRYREKKGNRGSLAAPGGAKQPDAKGSVRLKVKYQGGTAQSDAIPYKVFCNAKAPARSRLRKN
jgi:hypothetical protein